MKSAQDYMNGSGGTAFAGFNRRIYGETRADAFQYPHERQDDGSRLALLRTIPGVNAGCVHGTCSPVRRMRCTGTVSRND